MKPTIASTGATLGALVTDTDLAQLDDATWATIEAAFHEYGILIFPGQRLSEEAQIAFGARFGELEQLAPNLKSVTITNRKRDGSLSKADDHGARLQRGNEGWHTDSSYMPLASKASVFSAHVVPPEGGQTEWADMRAAYDELDDATKEQIADMSAYHSLYHSQAQLGYDVRPGASYGFHIEESPLRPLVKVHPVTGRKSLFIGRHAYGIPGLEKAESKKLLDDLLAFACQAPRTYTHDWVAGDIVVWDNRCVLHRARPYDHESSPRVMRHTRVAGDPATELALNTTLRSNADIRRQG